jgi:hypothetical protein
MSLIALAMVAALTFPGAAATTAKGSNAVKSSATVMGAELDPETTAETAARHRDEAAERRAELRRARRERITPYYGCTASGCGRYAIPSYIVDCESGGRFNDPSAPNGAYALLSLATHGVPTWDDWRPGWASGYAMPYQAPRLAQDIAAHRLWMAYGSEPWECA